MPNIFKFKDFHPQIHSSAFVHPNATVTGNVVIGKEVYIGPGASIRGDWGKIIIEDGCNVQDNCTIHMFPGVTVVLMEGAHIGHGAIIHGATIGRNVLVGMNAVIMDNARVGNNCIIAALCMVPSEMQIPEGKVVVGVPAKITKDVTEKMLKWKIDGTDIYRKLPADCHKSLNSAKSRNSSIVDSPEQDKIYRSWKETKKDSK